MLSVVDVRDQENASVILAANQCIGEKLMWEVFPLSTGLLWPHWTHFIHFWGLNKFCWTVQPQWYEEVRMFLLPLNLWRGSPGAFEGRGSRSSRGRPEQLSVSLQDQDAHWADLWLWANGCYNSLQDWHKEPAHWQRDRDRLKLNCFYFCWI